MTPLERELLLKELREGPRRVVGDAVVDIGGSALAGIDRAVTPAAKAAQLRMLQAGGGIGAGGSTGPLGALTRMAGGKAALSGLKMATGLGAVGGVLGAADVLAGDTSLLNKGMDATAMGIGAALGSFAGPMGMAAGAGYGKMASDGLQYLFGDKKSPKQRELENALAALNAGRIG